MDIFEIFAEGKLSIPQYGKEFGSTQWSEHPIFQGVRLKHIVMAADTGGQFSYHLVQIDPGKKIGMHVHEKQMETHEVIAGSGICVNDRKELEYRAGVISIFSMNIPHEISAGGEGLYLFAKFFPALC